MSEQVAYGIIGVFVVKEVLSLLLKSVFNKTAVHIKAIEENTRAIIKLETKLDIVFQSIAEIPKIKNDVHEAHTRIREMRAQTQGGN